MFGYVGNGAEFIFFDWDDVCSREGSRRLDVANQINAYKPNRSPLKKGQNVLPSRNERQGKKKEKNKDGRLFN